MACMRKCQYGILVNFSVGISVYKFRALNILPSIKLIEGASWWASFFAEIAAAELQAASVATMAAQAPASTPFILQQASKLFSSDEHGFAVFVAALGFTRKYRNRILDPLDIVLVHRWVQVQTGDISPAL